MFQFQCVIALMFYFGAMAAPVVVAGPEQLKFGPFKDEARPKPVTISKPIYKPPRGLGKPKGRIGGGTRSRGGERAAVVVLAPGPQKKTFYPLTFQASPSLYWYISRRPQYPVQLTLNHEQRIEPILEVNLPRPRAAGIQRVRLKDYHVQLSPGAKYEWMITLVIDSNNPSRNIVQRGFIERVKAAERFGNTLVPEKYAAYGDAGLWYDVLDALSIMVDADPGNAALHGHRDALLEQVGLAQAMKH